MYKKLPTNQFLNINFYNIYLPVYLSIYLSIYLYTYTYILYIYIYINHNLKDELIVVYIFDMTPCESFLHSNNGSSTFK